MSQSSYLKNLSKMQRLDFLESNAAKVEQGKYAKPLSEDELIELKNNLAENSIKLSDIKEEFDVVKKEFSQRKEPLVDNNKSILHQIRSRQQLLDGKIYHLPNFEDRMMESYDQDGELISTRRLRPDEQQGNLLSIAQ